MVTRLQKDLSTSDEKRRSTLPIGKNKHLDHGVVEYEGWIGQSRKLLFLC